MNYCWIMQKKSPCKNKQMRKKRYNGDLKSILLYNVNCLNTVQMSLRFFQMIHSLLSHSGLYDTILKYKFFSTLYMNL